MGEFTKIGSEMPELPPRIVGITSIQNSPEGLERSCLICKRALPPMRVGNGWLPRKCHCERDWEEFCQRKREVQMREQDKRNASCDKCYTWLGTDLNTLREKIFHTFDRECFPAIYDRLLTFVSERDEMGEPVVPFTNFLIFGGFGTGKTHIMSAILNSFCDLGIPCRFMTGQDLFDRISECFSNRTDPTPYIDEASSIPVLGIDDIGMIHIPVQLRESEDNFQAKTMFKILNARYLKRLPTIITTNTLDISIYISGAAVSRLMEQGEILQMNGNDYRQRNLRIIG